MSSVMAALHEEHRGIARLLRALEYQIGVFESGRRPDYDVLSGIADYFTGFPEECHHPKEDLLYRKMRERAPEEAEAVSSIEGEHDKISKQAAFFHDTVQSILLEAEISRETAAKAMRDFAENQRHHMMAEEKYFFPLAEKTLIQEDWDELDAAVGNQRDPLFGPEVTEAFRSLLDSILTWEKEFEESQQR